LRAPDRLLRPLPAVFRDRRDPALRPVRLHAPARPLAAINLLRLPHLPPRPPFAFHRVNERRSLQMRTAQNELSAEFLDAMQGLPTLKVFGQSGRWGERLAQRSRQVFRTIMHVLAVNIGTTGVTMLGITAGSAVALTWGAVRVEQGDLELRPDRKSTRLNSSHVKI